jgi:NADH-quinone oxidoreductase subunit H
MIKDLFELLIIPGFLFTLALGFLASWIDRKVTARVQWRQGPPVFQPLADILKLMGKEITVPDTANKLIFLSAPILGLSAATLVATMLWMVNLNSYGSFIGDLIVIVYLFTMPSLALIIAGSSSGNPLSAIGSSREMKLIMAYELPFIIAVFTVVLKTGNLLIGGIINYQTVQGPIFYSISGAIAFIVCIFVIQAKLGFVPFDAAEAEQELMGGPLLEYSGAPLAAFKITKAILLFTLPFFLITLFFGGIVTTSVAGVMLFIFRYVIILTVLILIKNTNPRLRIDHALKFFWGPVTVMAVLAFVLAAFGL